MADNVNMQGLQFTITADTKDATANLKELSAALRSLQNIASKGLSSSNGIGQFLTKLQTETNKVNADTLSAKLTKIGNAMKVFGTGQRTITSSTALSSALTDIRTAVSELSEETFRKLDSLSRSINALRASSDGTPLSATVGRNITALGAAVRDLDWMSGDKLSALADGLTNLSAAPKPQNIGSYIKELNKFPEVIGKFRELDLDEFTAQIGKLTKALKPLATEMERISGGFSNLPERFFEMLRGGSSEGDGFSNRRGSLTSKITEALSLYNILRKIPKVIIQSINESNEYQEDLNLFTVALGKYAEKTKAYGESVSEIMGIDPAEWLRNQGVFNTLFTGFGNVGNRAQVMSKNMTQLGYDLSSFFNISVEDAMQKLQSGVSGELEPLRRLGYDLSDAKIKATALSLGIDKATNSMNQAEKAELRYYAIMNQVTGAQGDMARSLDTPANQLRILKSLFTQAARAIGNIFIPALNAVLPVAIAVVQAIKEIADSIASLFGFHLTEVDYSDVSQNTADTAENLGKAAGAAKKLKSYTLGIDELNVIDSKSGGGGGGGSSYFGSGFDFDLPEYDFLKGLTGQISELKDKLEPIMKMVAAIGAGILAWKIVNNFLDGLKNVSKYLGNIASLGVRNLDIWDRWKLALGGVITAAVGLVLVADSAYDIGRGVATITTYIQGAFGLIAAGIGGAMTGAAIAGAPGAIVGATISVALALLVGVVFYKQGQQKAIVDAFYESNVGKEILNLREKIETDNELALDLSARVQSITGEIDGDLLVDLNTAQTLVDQIFAIDANENLTSAQIADIQSKIETLNSLGLPGISLEFDTFSGHVVETKEAIEETIKALQTQYQLEALKDSIVEAYKAKEEALMGYNSALKDRESVEGKIQDQLRLINEAENTRNQQLKKAVELYGDGTLAYAVAANTIRKEFNPAIEAQTEILTEMYGDLAAVNENVDAFADATVQAEGKIGYLNDRMSEMTNKLTTVAEEALPAGSETMNNFAEGIKKGSKTATNSMATAVDSLLAEQRARNSISSGKSGTYKTEGTYLMAGLADGITESTSLVTDGMTTAMDELLKAERAKNGINSPSTVYKDEGRYLMEGMANGIRNNKGQVRSAMNEMLNELLSEMRIFTVLCTNALNRMIQGFATTMESLKVDSTTGKVRYTPVSPPYISRMAQGGFVDKGELFIAREAGAEMVGRVGRKTAVANNDQIVEGISSGVSVANESVVAAIYALLDVVESKDVNVNIGDDQVGRSYDRYNQRRGIRVNSGAFANAY